MNKIYVTNIEGLTELYEGSAFTLEGLAEESIPDFIQWIKGYSEMEAEDVYIISGRLMNDSFNLTGTNRYPEDLTIVSIPLYCIKEINKIAIPRFNIGARWFDDIVDNNLAREELNP